MVKHLPAIRATWVQSFGWEDPLEKEMTPVFLSGESHRQTSLVGYSPRGCKESDTTEQLHFHFLYLFNEVPTRPYILGTGITSGLGQLKYNNIEN